MHRFAPENNTAPSDRSRDGGPRARDPPADVTGLFDEADAGPGMLSTVRSRYVEREKDTTRTRPGTGRVL